MNPKEGRQQIHALEGYRVLDFGRVWAGPMVGQLLADMGAEVIKIETRSTLDLTRLGRPVIGDDVAGGDEGRLPDVQPSFHGLNRNKLSFTIDLKHPRARDIIYRLVKISDVVIDNFRPGTMEKLGLDHKSLEAIRPDIISISLTACGESGPLKDAIAYGPNTIALGGLNSLIGYPEDEALCMISTPYGDANASIHGVFAVLAALWHREETGEGQHIEVSQAEGVTSLLGEAIMDYAMNGRTLGPQGNYHPTMSPHGSYPCKGEDKWVSIAVKTDEEWESLCLAIGEPDWIEDERFADRYSRLKNRKELDALISHWTRNYSPYEIMETLQRAGVAALPVMNSEDQFTDVHYRERQTFIEIEQPQVGVELLYGIPWRLSKTPGDIRQPAPSLGEHNDYVLGKLLGFSPGETRELIAQKVVY
jgi:benzylsuccinate CoA-transferase BbsF subunit